MGAAAAAEMKAEDASAIVGGRDAPGSRARAVATGGRAASGAQPWQR